MKGNPVFGRAGRPVKAQPEWTPPTPGPYPGSVPAPPGYGGPVGVGNTIMPTGGAPIGPPPPLPRKHPIPTPRPHPRPRPRPRPPRRRR